MAIALVSDGLSFFLSPTVIAEPLVIGIDLVTGVLIWLALGRPILLFAVFLAEAIPGVGMIPLWTMVVAILATTGRLPSRMGAMTSSQKNSPNDPANPPQLLPIRNCRISNSRISSYRAVATFLRDSSGNAPTRAAIQSLACKVLQANICGRASEFLD